MPNNHQDEFDLDTFYKKLIHPIPFDCNSLESNKNQVAGHAGFYSTHNEPKICLKPFNTKCVRGRREHLFYQLMEHFKGRSIGTPSENLDIDSAQLRNETAPKLYYKYFNLLCYPIPPTKCNCIIDGEMFKLLSTFVADFYHVRHLYDCVNDIQTNPLEGDQYLNSVYSGEVKCPCYGSNPKEKSSCSREYDQVDFLCLEDLTSHCQRPCIVDIKIGQITYDPMAIKEKVLEQSSKYRRLREFGFRILGMKLGDEIKSKSFGKTLDTTGQVREALLSFFEPLRENQYKSAAMSRILSILHDLLEWFEKKNISQLKFFSSSLLIVYDSHIPDVVGSATVIQERISKSVRVNMIDFAHVFHVHDSSGEKSSGRELDNNYIFGLRKLIDFISKLNAQC